MKARNMAVKTYSMTDKEKQDKREKSQ